MKNKENIRCKYLLLAGVIEIVLIILIMAILEEKLSLDLLLFNSSLFALPALFGVILPVLIVRNNKKNIAIFYRKFNVILHYMFLLQGLYALFVPCSGVDCISFDHPGLPIFLSFLVFVITTVIYVLVLVVDKVDNH